MTDFAPYATEVVAGIDYSLKSPCICVIPPTPHNEVIVPFASCHFHYLTDRRSAIVAEQNIHGELMGDWECEDQRYETIADWAIRVLQSYKCVSVGLEGYAYGAANPSRLAQLCENQGLLKHSFYKAGIHYNIFPPTTIKKMATSNGRSTKEQMYDAWIKDTDVCLKALFGRTDGKVKSPISDIVDSFYIACSQRIDMIQTNYAYEKGTTNDRKTNGNKGK